MFVFIILHYVDTHEISHHVVYVTTLTTGAMIKGNDAKMSMVIYVRLG